MRKILLLIVLILSLAVPASALEITAPPVPESGKTLMPEDTDSFGDSFWSLLRNAVLTISPDLKEASGISISLVSAVMLFSLLQTFSGTTVEICKIAGCCTVTAVLLSNASAMIQLGANTIRELSDYGKLLYPVMTAAMAAQGGIQTSAALYTGTALMDALLGSLMSSLLIPMIYLFLALAAANHALGEDSLKNMCSLLKNGISWFLKTILTVFTTYMSITGVVSGTADAAALKTAKVTISSVVPVVGGILSDSSEAILVSAGLLKNAAGIYGILVIFAVFLNPFLKIGVHYLMLKLTSAICSLFAPKEISGLIEDFSAAMGLLLAMTGSVCLLLLISTVCFMKGVG